MVRTFVFMALLLGGSRAWAAPEAAPVTAARELVARQVALLATGVYSAEDQAKLTALFTPDAFAFFWPGATTTTNAELTEAVVNEWFMAQCAPGNMHAARVEAGALGDAAAWVTFDLAYTYDECVVDGPNKITHYTGRVTELVRRDPDSGAWRVQALEYSEPVRDDQAIAAALAGTLEVPDLRPYAEGGEVDAPLVQLLLHPDQLADAFAKIPGVTLIGSAAKERAVGQAAARKLARSWKNATFEILGGVRLWAAKDCRYVATIVKATLPVKQKKVAVYYRVLLIAGADGTVVSVHYAGAPAR
jgi:hypothetical protein